MNNNPTISMHEPGLPPASSAPDARLRRLPEAFRDAIRLEHYGLRAEETYIHRIKRVMSSHGKRHPREMGGMLPESSGRVPEVLSVSEVSALLAGMTGTKWMRAALLCGCGLRLREVLALSVRGADFGYRQVGGAAEL